MRILQLRINNIYWKEIEYSVDLGTQLIFPAKYMPFIDSSLSEIEYKDVVFNIEKYRRGRRRRSYWRGDLYDEKIYVDTENELCWNKKDEIVKKKKEKKVLPKKSFWDNIDI